MVSTVLHDYAQIIFPLFLLYFTCNIAFSARDAPTPQLRTAGEGLVPEAGASEFAAASHVTGTVGKPRVVVQGRSGSACVESRKED